MSAGGYTRDYDIATPIDHTKFKDQPGHVRASKEDVAERLASFMYGFTSGETTKGLKFLEFVTQATAPSTAADSFMLYAKDVDGKAELHGKSEDDVEVVLTRLGKLLLDSGILTNDTFLKALNAAGTGTVDLIKANASDKPVLPDGSELASSAAPTTDVQVVNKKYVDDEIIANAQVGFGSWVDKSSSITAQQAATDGFVVLTGIVNAGGESIVGYTDANADPTTERCKMTMDVSVQTANYSFTMPVKKGHYWKVVNTNATITSVFWIPLGA